MPVGLAVFVAPVVLLTTGTPGDPLGLHRHRGDRHEALREVGAGPAPPERGAARLLHRPIVHATRRRVASRRRALQKCFKKESTLAFGRMVGECVDGKSFEVT